MSCRTINCCELAAFSYDIGTAPTLATPGASCRTINCCDPSPFDYSADMNPYITDENGNPILDENGNPILRDL